MKKHRLNDLGVWHNSSAFSSESVYTVSIVTPSVDLSCLLKMI